jgi:DNA-binding transcriptional regulator YiaG
MSPRQIRKLRLARCLTQDGLAAECGFKGKARYMNVYKWEAGITKPSAPVMKMLERMAKGRKV